jgi:hypothetical protein
VHLELKEDKELKDKELKEDKEDKELKDKVLEDPSKTCFCNLNT